MDNNLVKPLIFEDVILTTAEGVLGFIRPNQYAEFSSQDQAEEMLKLVKEAGILDAKIEFQSNLGVLGIDYINDEFKIFNIVGSAKVPNDVVNGHRLPDHIVPFVINVGKRLELHRDRKSENQIHPVPNFGNKLAWQEAFPSTTHEPGEVPSHINVDWSDKSGRVAPQPATPTE